MLAAVHVLAAALRPAAMSSSSPMRAKMSRGPLGQRAAPIRSTPISPTSKRRFAELIRGNISPVDTFIESVTAGLGGTNALEDYLCAVAHRHVRAVVLPEAVQLRRLVTGEAGRFPDLAREYYERVPQRVIAALAQQPRRLAERGLLRREDPAFAANHLAWLILGPPLDAAMFDAAVDVFLAAYGYRRTAVGSPPTHEPRDGNM